MSELAKQAKISYERKPGMLHSFFALKFHDGEEDRAKIEGIENGKPMTHALDDFVFELREDVAEESIPIEELLQNCKDSTGREVQVPKVVG